jgi:hypothetical protein
MTAFRIIRRTQELDRTLYFVIVSAVPAEGSYGAQDILVKTGNAFAREAAQKMEREFEEQLVGEIRARGHTLIAG